MTVRSFATDWKRMTLHESILPVFGLLLSAGLFGMGFVVAWRLQAPLVYSVSVAGGIWAARSILMLTVGPGDGIRAELFDVTALLSLLIGLLGLWRRLLRRTSPTGTRLAGDPV